MKGSTNMKKIKRAIHFDFHTLPGIDDFCANFDAEKFASQLADAHVDYVNMFARCNIGFSYYPTKMGTPYPTMKGNMFGDVLRECHKKGILVTAYLNGGLNHELLVKNPGFMKIFKDGNVYKGNLAKNNFFREPCFNTPYRQYLLDEIKEILEMDPDGIFCDCIMTTSCYCPACIKKMNEQGIDTSNDEAVFAFALDTIREVFAEIRAIVPKDKRLYLNSHPYEDVAKHQSHAEVECLPTGGWGYDFLPAAAPYFRKFSDDLLYMTGRFVRSWGDFGGVKTITAIENDVYDGLLYGYAPSIGDHLHPRDGLIDSLYKEIGKIYAYVMELEKWTDNTKPKTEVAILRNKITHKNVRKHTQDSDKGAARMLSELKISYDAINEDMDLDEYKLIVIPSNIDITDKLYAKIENYKGKIISTGKAIREGKVWDYISEFADDTNTDGFYAYKGEVCSMYEQGIKMKSDYSTVDYIEPYFNSGFDGIHSYYYVPPKDSKGYSAVAKKDGKVHICFDIFASYIKYGAVFQKGLFKDIIDELLPDRVIDPCDLPSFVRASVMEGELGDVLHVKTTFPEHRGEIGIVEDHVTMPAGKKISIMGEYAKVCTLPDEAPVASCIVNGRTIITLPEITGYKPFLMTK